MSWCRQCQIEGYDHRGPCDDDGSMPDIQIKATRLINQLKGRRGQPITRIHNFMVEELILVLSTLTQQKDTPNVSPDAGPTGTDHPDRSGV